MSLNSCIVAGTVVRSPQVRHTQDNLAITEMLITIPALREGESPGGLKAVQMGKHAPELPRKAREGDSIILEGSLRMNMVQLQSGTKEKRAELRIVRIHSVSAGEGGEIIPAPSKKQPSPPPNSSQLPPPSEFDEDIPF